MNTSAEAADQVVRMSLNGAEAALKITGSASKEVAKLLFKAIKDLSKQTKKTKGQMRLSNLVKSGKKLEIYQVADANLKRFCEQAKKYGTAEARETLMRSALPSAVRQDGAHLQPHPFLLLDFRPIVFATALNNLKAKRINAFQVLCI